MHWIAYLFIANCAIAFVEYTYRAGQYESFFVALPYIIVPILIGQFGLFYGFKEASSLFLASGVFTLINVLFRIAVTYYLGEQLNVANWIGVAMLSTSVILLKVK